MIKFEPFPELADILLLEQYETFDGYWQIQARRGRVKVEILI